MNSGICKGGPFDGRPTHHPELTMRVAIDKVTKKASTAVRGAGFDFGRYVFDGKVWHWEFPIRSAG